MNNIILCGFMGCGKTTVGKRLARLAGMAYGDLDAELAAETGMPVAEIFNRLGEPHFRALEHEAVRGLAARAGCVISTGGGAMTFARNLAVIDRRDTVVFLDADFVTCYARIRNSDRPIVRASTPDALRALFERRRAAYLAAAALRVDANPPAGQVAGAVLRRLAELGKLELP